jgi:hypothetical protein
VRELERVLAGEWEDHHGNVKERARRMLAR